MILPDHTVVILRNEGFGMWNSEPVGRRAVKVLWLCSCLIAPMWLECTLNVPFGLFQQSPGLLGNSLGSAEHDS